MGKLYSSSEPIMYHSRERGINRLVLEIEWLWTVLLGQIGKLANTGYIYIYIIILKYNNFVVSRFNL